MEIHDYKFYNAFKKVLSIELNLSATHHPQIDDQCKRNIHALQDKNRSFIFDFGGS